jgi:hypothetical protein
MMIMTMSTHAPAAAPTIAPRCDVFTWPIAVEMLVFVDPSAGALADVGGISDGSVPALRSPKLAAADALVKGGREFAIDAEKPAGVGNEGSEVMDTREDTYELCTCEITTAVDVIIVV